MRRASVPRPIPEVKTAADVVVAGAGPAGTALAIRLARVGGRVVLLDDRVADPALWPDLPGERLGADAALALDALGIEIGAIAARESAMVRLWSGARPDAAPAGRPGFLVSRRVLDAALLAAARTAGAQSWPATAFAGIDGQPGDWRIWTQTAAKNDPRPIAARLVVDATGRRRAVARALGLSPPARADAMTAILRWSTGLEAPPAFLLEAAGSGWWYAATLPGGRAVAGLVAPRGLWSGRPGPAWDGALARTDLVGPWLAGQAVPSWGPPSVLPAAPALAPRVLGPGWALIGDAARRADPVAGRGVLHAVESAALLAAVILGPPEAAAKAAGDYVGWLSAAHCEHLATRAAAYAASDRLDASVIACVAAPYVAAAST